MERYGFLSEHHTEWSVEEMCRVWSVSRSGFYAWLGRPESVRAQQTRRLDADIRRLFEVHKGWVSSPKMTHLLRQDGWQVGGNRVARRMRAMGLRSKVRRAYRTTTDSRPAYPVAPNRLQRDFTAQGPDQVYVSDITFGSVRAGCI